LCIRDIYQIAPTPRYWAPAAARLDDVAPGAIIAVTSGPNQNGDNWFTYFFLGARLQNRLTYLSPRADGAIPPRGADSGDRAAWLHRLAQRGVTHVVSFTPPSLEKTWMDADPQHFQRLDGDDAWGAYLVRR
jgi:hypothetical protein